MTRHHCYHSDTLKHRTMWPWSHPSDQCVGAADQRSHNTGIAPQHHQVAASSTAREGSTDRSLLCLPLLLHPVRVGLRYPVSTWFLPILFNDHMGTGSKAWGRRTTQRSVESLGQRDCGSRQNGLTMSESDSGRDLSVEEQDLGTQS